MKINIFKKCFLVFAAVFGSVGFVYAQNPAAPYQLATYTNSCASISPPTNDIVNVFKTTINNYPAGKNIRNVNSGCGNSIAAAGVGGFYNYTLHPPIEGKVLVVRRGDQFRVTVGAGKSFGQHFKVWVDWNQNNQYNNATTGAAAELVYQTTGTALEAENCIDTLVGDAVSQSGWITVPMTAACGQTRIRVRSVFATTTFTPTDNQLFGEIEEYYVVVLNNPETPEPILNFTDKSICVGKSVTIKASSPGGGTINFFNKFSSTTAMASNVTGGVTVGPDSLKFNILNNDTMIYVQNTQAGCKSKRVAVSISTQTLPTLSIMPNDTTICKLDTVTLVGNLDTLGLTNIYKKFGENVPSPYRKILDDSGPNGSHCGTRRERTIEANNVRPTILTSGSIAEVGVRIMHKRIKDISIELVAPNGSRITLSSANGSNNVIANGGNYGSGTSALNYTYCKFTDTSAVSITTVTTPQITGYKKPQQLLSSLSGSANGYWTLLVRDIAAPITPGTDDDGLLYSWYIKFKRDNFTDTVLTWSPLNSLSAFSPINTWSDNNKRFAFPTVTTTYFLEIENTYGCSAKDSTTITVAPSIQLSATSNPTQICVGQQATLTATALTGIQSTSWSPNFTPIAGVTANVSPQTTTQYKVIALSALGCKDSATVNVIVNQLPSAPTISSTGSTTVCAGNNVVLQSNQATGNLWSTSQNTQSVTFSSSSPNVTCTYTDANGCTSLPSTPVNVVVNALPIAPTITAGSALTFCAGNSVTLTAPIGYSYNWYQNNVSNFANTQNITVSNTNNYKVVVTDANGCTATSASTSVLVNSLPATPVITAMGPTSFCPGGNVTLSSSQANSYTWQPTALDMQTNTVALAGSYTVSVTDLNGCTSLPSNAIIVSILNNPSVPVITASGPLSICIGNDVTLSGPTSSSYLWNPGGQTTQSITVNSTGSYSVQVTGANGCTSVFSSSANVVVNNLPSAATITALTPTTICEGGTAILSAGNYASYQWSNGSVGNPLNVGTQGSYSVIVTDANGCTAPASLPLQVNVNALPQTPTISAGGPTTFCAFDSVKLQINSNVSNLNYMWAPSSVTTTNNYIYVKTTGDYNVRAVDANGCASQPSASIQVNVITVPPPPQITTIGSTVFCKGDSVTLSINSGESFLWNTGATSQSISVSSSDIFSAVVTDICAITHNPSITITALDNPIPDFDADELSGCSPLSVKFNNKSQNAVSYVWSFGLGQTSVDFEPIATFINPYKYSIKLTAKAANGCIKSKTNFNYISVGNKPYVEFDYYPKPALTSTPFVQFESKSEGVKSLLWVCNDYAFTDTSWRTKIFMPDTGLHKVTLIVANEFGCVDSIDYDVLVEGEFLMFMPNAFTPSTKDELNDNFKPVSQYLDKKNFHMMVYDRWGTKVFDTTNPDLGWDGSVTNMPVTGMFNWIVECLDKRGIKHFKTGAVNVIR